jgi:DNA-binding PadR family transcriptional regulator
VELADALDSGSSGRKAVGVQVPSLAPGLSRLNLEGLFIYAHTFSRPQPLKNTYSANKSGKATFVHYTPICSTSKQ